MRESGRIPWPAHLSGRLRSVPGWSSDLSLAETRCDIRDACIFGEAQGTRVRSRRFVDGSPALKGGELVRALQGGDVLAILVVESGAGRHSTFFPFPGPRVIGAFPLPDRPVGTAFALTRDGQRFARPLDSRRLEVRDVPGDQPPLLVTPARRCVDPFRDAGKVVSYWCREFDLGGPRRARFSWLIRWDQGWLDLILHEADSLLDQLGGVVAVSRSVPAGNHGLGYDPDRFVQMIESRGLRILIDRYNHLVVLGRGGELVCMMFVSCREFAAWLPDGTMFGPRRLIGGEPTPGASERIAAALKRAEQGGGSSS